MRLGETTVRLSQEVLDRINQEAKRLGVPRSILIRNAITSAFGDEDELTRLKRERSELEKKVLEISARITELERSESLRLSEREKALDDYYVRFYRPRRERAELGEGRPIVWSHLIEQHMDDGYYDLGRTGMTVPDILSQLEARFQEEWRHD